MCNQGFQCFEAGRKQVEQDNFEQALPNLIRATELGFSSDSCNYYLSRSLFATGQYAASVRYALATLLENKNFTAVYDQLGMSLRNFWWSKEDIVFISCELDPLIEQYLTKYGENALIECVLHLEESKHFHAAWLIGRFAKNAKTVAPGSISLRHTEASARNIDQCRVMHLTTIKNYPEDIEAVNEYANFLADLGEDIEPERMHREIAKKRKWFEPSSLGLKFRYDWFSHNLELWNAIIIPHIASIHGVRILEIGCHEGTSTSWFLTQIVKPNSGRIDCIDIQFQANFHYNMVAVDAAGYLRTVEASSSTALADWDSERYDLIYIDSDHSQAQVEQDAKMTLKLLKPGGMMIFDDYGCNDFAGVKIAVDAFVTTHTDWVEPIYAGYQYFIIKRSTNTT